MSTSLQVPSAVAYLVPPEHADAAQRIAALERRTRDALEYLADIVPNWVPKDPAIDHDVLIVGGGQTGVALAFALRRAGIGNVSVIDAADEGLEGVWLTCARMETLRSVKTLPGPELGLESLTFRSWYEARFGEKAFAVLERCERTVWSDYVRWYRRTTGIEVRNGVRLERILRVADGFRVELAVDGKKRYETVRKIVLATGMIGAGKPAVPPVISVLPRDRWVHTDERWDPEIFRHRTVAVLGAASSAFDAAAVALEHGASAVHLFSRHADLVRVTLLKGLSYPGALENFPELPDEAKWHLIRFITRRSAGPIADTVRRATTWPNFHLHFKAGWRATEMASDQVQVTLETGQRYAFDMVVAGTGYEVDLSARPELDGISDKIALWRDRYVPPAGEESERLGRYPYLGSGFEFCEKSPGEAPWLADIHCLNNAAVVSLGRAVGEIISIRYCIPRLVSRLGRDLFLADRLKHTERIKSFDRPDLTGEEYAGAVWRDPPATKAPIGEHAMSGMGE